MMIQKKWIQSFFLALCITAYTGCVGIGMPDVFQWKPWTLLSEGDQFGRDQLANRYMVAKKVIPVKGLEENEVLTVLGQPQQVKVYQKDISEDWTFVYYKRYKTWPRTDEGSFVIRFQNNTATEMAIAK